MKLRNILFYYFYLQGICVVLAVLSLFTLYTNNTSGYKCVGDDVIPTSYTVSCALITASFVSISWKKKKIIV